MFIKVFCYSITCFNQTICSIIVKNIFYRVEGDDVELEADVIEDVDAPDAASADTGEYH